MRLTFGCKLQNWMVLAIQQKTLKISLKQSCGDNWKVKNVLRHFCSSDLICCCLGWQNVGDTNHTQKHVAKERIKSQGQKLQGVAHKGNGRSIHWCNTDDKQ